MNVHQKQLKKEYQQGHPPMGVYQIRNLVNEKLFIGMALNLPGILNRHKFELEMGKHRNQQLQAEWNEFGSRNFVFEILDEIQPRSEPGYDHRADLQMLEEMWCDNLQPYDERGYNERALSREEKLQRIALNRLQARDDEAYED